MPITQNTKTPELGSPAVRNSFGATQAEWDFFRGLAERDLLPVVSNTGARISPESTMKDLGKTPSRYNASGDAVGIAKWPEHIATAAEVARWSKQPDYGICLQTRTYRAIDVDVTDQQEADAIFKFLTAELGSFARRVRANSSKFLLLVNVEGDIRKTTIKTKHGIIEFLANGQQCIVAGMHPSGARYEWSPGLPERLPVLTQEAYTELQGVMNMLFGFQDIKAARNSVSRASKVVQAEDEDPIAQYLYDNDYVLGSAPGVLHIRCPFEGEHTSPSAISSTSYFVRYTNGYAEGAFKCLHAHCQGRHNREFREAIGYETPLEVEFENLDAQQDGTTAEQTAEGEATEAPKKKRFAVMSTAEFLALPKLEWLVKNLIPKRGLGVIYGPPSSGKTFFALDLAASIARGVSWRDIIIKEKKRVVYVCAEGIGGFRNRVDAYLQHNEGANMSAFGVIADKPDLLDKNTVRELIVSIGKADLVVMDTFASVMTGDENSSVDMGRAIRACELVSKKTGAAVLLIHHTRKDGKEARGHSSLKGALDLEIEVAQFDSGDRSALVVKSKDGGIEGSDYGFKLVKLTIGKDDDELPVTSCVVEVNENVNKEKKGGKRAKHVPRNDVDLSDAD